MYGYSAQKVTKAQDENHTAHPTLVPQENLRPSGRDLPKVTLAATRPKGSGPDSELRNQIVALLPWELGWSAD